MGDFADLVTTALEGTAVLLLAVGAGLVVAGLVSGLVGAGAALAAAAGVLLVASIVLRVLWSAGSDDGGESA